MVPRQHTIQCEEQITVKQTFNINTESKTKWNVPKLLNILKCIMAQNSVQTNAKFCSEKKTTVTKGQNNDLIKAI